MKITSEFDSSLLTNKQLQEVIDDCQLQISLRKGFFDRNPPHEGESLNDYIARTCSCPRHLNSRNCNSICRDAIDIMTPIYVGAYL